VAVSSVMASQISRALRHEIEKEAAARTKADAAFADATAAQERERDSERARETEHARERETKDQQVATKINEFEARLDSLEALGMQRAHVTAESYILEQIHRLVGEPSQERWRGRAREKEGESTLPSRAEWHRQGPDVLKVGAAVGEDDNGEEADAPHVRDADERGPFNNTLKHIYTQTQQQPTGFSHAPMHMDGVEKWGGEEGQTPDTRADAAARHVVADAVASASRAVCEAQQFFDSVATHDDLALRAAVEVQEEVMVRGGGRMARSDHEPIHRFQSHDMSGIENAQSGWGSRLAVRAVGLCEHTDLSQSEDISMSDSQMSANATRVCEAVSPQGVSCISTHDHTSPQKSLISPQKSLISLQKSLISPPSSPATKQLTCADLSSAPAALPMGAILELKDTLAQLSANAAKMCETAEKIVQPSFPAFKHVAIQKGAISKFKDTLAQLSENAAITCEAADKIVASRFPALEYVAVQNGAILGLKNTRANVCEKRREISEAAGKIAALPSPSPKRVAASTQSGALSELKNTLADVCDMQNEISDAAEKLQYLLNSPAPKCVAASAAADSDASGAHQGVLPDLIATLEEFNEQVPAHRHRPILNPQTSPKYLRTNLA